MTRSEALALRPGDRLIVAGRTRYTVIARPVQRGGRPLMIAARSDEPGANAKWLQFGSVRIARA